MSVVSMIVGATGPGGATFVARVDGGGPVRVAVADNAAMTSPVFTSSQAVDGQGVAKVSITGLDPSTRYWWQVEDNGVLDTSITGQLLTYPPVGVAASFTFAAASCAGGNASTSEGSVLDPTLVSNHPVFDTIRQRALADDWLMFLHMGDLHYYDLGDTDVGPGTVANYRRSYDDVLLQPRQHQLYREVAVSYVWDDHDYGPDNSDGTLPTKGNAQQVYRERVPHYPLDDADAIYQSWQVGRVLFIASDVRSERSPNGDPDGPSKTMLGAAQKTWLRGVLEGATSARLLVWVTPSPWLEPSRLDTWAAFRTEQDELIGLFAETGWSQRMLVLWGDRHAIGLDSGSNVPGGMPGAQFAALDSGPATPDSERFDAGPESAQRAQYGTVAVTDLGSIITVRLTGWRDTEQVASLQVGFSVGAPVLAVTETAELVHGSHRATFEARVLTTFQTGPEPAGQVIPILGGDVQFDSTAKVFSSLSLDTEGHDGVRSLFPRLAGDLLAPYGNEVFVRRGVDAGAGIVWVPLGYFRVDAAEQGHASDHPIRLTGQDRMASIIDARLVEPVQFPATATVGSVVMALVGPIYPGVLIAWDDDSDQASLGRQLVVEEDRYGALLEIVESLGKVTYWDSEGVLRVEDAPDPETIVWDIRAGRQGVLVESNRGVSRDGMRNGFVARGEGATEEPVRAIVVDVGASSPTRWGGRFGRVPGFYASPLLTTEDEARKAAESLLRRHIGMPYSVDFGVVPNPALRPRDAVRVTHKDGNREKHIVERLGVPLVADAHMTGTTREQTLVQVGQLLPGSA